MREIAGIALLALLAGCQTIKTTPTTLDADQLQAVRNTVITSLKDPESARFGAINAGLTQKGPILVCGYVNAKNSFGGYTGESPFDGFLMPDKSFRLGGIYSDFDRSPSFAVATVANCRANGVPI